MRTRFARTQLSSVAAAALTLAVLAAARRAAAVCLAAAGVFLFAWTCGRPSEEARIRKFLEDPAARAEKRDIGGLMDLFDPGYTDFESRDKAGTVRLITEYLDRYRAPGVLAAFEVSLVRVAAVPAGCAHQGLLSSFT